MPGLNDIMDFIETVSNGDFKATKGMKDVFMKINNYSNQAYKNFNKNSSNQSDESTTTTDSINNNMSKKEKDNFVESVRKEDNKRYEAVNSNKNTTIINEIFKYEFDNDRLVEGMIFTEVFGKPLSKRRTRYRRAR